jgi:predicted nucleic acid-binding protein
LKLFVLDASVAVKWFLPREGESYVDEAFGLLDGYVNQKLDFISPDFFWAEFGNVLWKSVRRGRWPAESATEAVHHLNALQLPTIPAEDLLDDALALALGSGQTVYDSLYITLAMRSGGEMITADERLANALAARLPVRWLGSI